MKRLILASALALLPLLAGAQSPPAGASAPVTASQGSNGQTQPFRYRQTLDERFAEANTTKDGHLTQPQAASARWSYVLRNYEAMDKAHAGFVTVQDIRTFARERRLARENEQRQQVAPKPGAQSPG